jgi:hypothetical protein
MAVARPTPLLVTIMACDAQPHRRQETPVADQLTQLRAFAEVFADRMRLEVLRDEARVGRVA